jgi:hypothetical protein
MRRCIFGVLFLFSSAIHPVRAGDPDKARALAKEAVERLNKAVEGRDLDALMKLVDVPYCQDGRQIIKDREELRKAFEEVWAKRPKQPAKIKFHIREIATIMEFIKKKNAPPSRGADLSAVLGENHRVVYVEFERPTGGFQPVWIGVRIDRDQARIVGMVD